MAIIYMNIQGVADTTGTYGCQLQLTQTSSWFSLNRLHHGSVWILWIIAYSGSWLSLDYSSVWIMDQSGSFIHEYAAS